MVRPPVARLVPVVRLPALPLVVPRRVVRARARPVRVVLLVVRVRVGLVALLLLPRVVEVVVPRCL
jgi:hypothetical protein